MRLRTTKARIGRRTLIPNLLRNSGSIKLGFWSVAGGGTIVENAFTFDASSISQVEQDVLISSGTISKTFTAAVVVSCPSGTVQFRIKNTHGGILDNFSQNFTATTTPTLYVYEVSNGPQVGNLKQIFGIVNSSAGGAGGTVIVHSAFFSIGSFTAQKIIDRGGFEITN